eukprot:gb/GEZN01005995.1/.p1 GENE.gb/GEZN01005995.1/~~gb/GEZN01005995.1/.p1  ORF type:complete len:301 (+),score=30.19 gb/GEZN01005995.1/:117-1019(+)
MFHNCVWFLFLACFLLSAASTRLVASEEEALVSLVLSERNQRRSVGGDARSQRISTTGDPCNGDDHGQAGEFDLYIFQQEWQAGYCFSDQNAEGCLYPTVYMLANFTVHGLWPQYVSNVNGYWWPQCCPSPYGSTLSQETVKSLFDPLHLFWPDVNGVPWPEYNSSNFWDHEWGKHGTCSGLPQLDYMSSAMQVQDSFPVPRDIIKNAGGTLDRAVIDQYYNNGNPCIPKVDCVVVLGCTGKFLISVSSCWTKKLTQIPCNAFALSEDNCPSSGILYIDSWASPESHKSSQFPRTRATGL